MIRLILLERRSIRLYLRINILMMMAIKKRVDS